MKNILQLSFLSTLLLVGVNSFSQTQNYCGSDIMRKELIAKYPGVIQSEQELENFTAQFAAAMSGQRSGPIVIPIVFHIIHRGGVENISDAQVLDQMRILNEDFNKGNADLADVIAPFRSVIGDIGIEFRLPTKDPDGNPTNGIEHIWGSQTYLGNDECKLNPWPRESYLNIWVFAKMRSGVAGYAYLPGSVNAVGELPMIDGINILHQYIGSIGTGSPYTSRALTHEIGHFLNLPHCWGNTNEPGIACDDDGVYDTPLTKGYTSCPAPVYTYRDSTGSTQVFPASKVDSLYLANPDFYADSIWRRATICTPHVVENFQNFMEYSYCDKMFTEGQKTRMLAALNSSKANRDSLWTETNLIETGTDQNTPCVCIPISDFSANKLFACVGDPVIYTDNSYNATVSSRFWTFPGGDIGDSFNPSATVVYNAQGVYPVTLTVENGNGNSSKTQSLVTVKDTFNLSTPYYDNFEDQGDFNYWWAPINVDRDAAQFQYCNTAGRNQSKSILLNTFMNRADMNVDELISPAFDCSTLTNANARLSFYYSYATWNSAFTFFSATDNTADSLVVYAQKGCSGTWVKVYANGANNVFNAGVQQGPYVPGTDQIFWKKVDFAIPTAFRTRGVRFRVVVMSSHFANNFYLDDWNIGAVPTGLEEVALDNINVMPNPFTSMVRLENLPDEQLSYEVRDITGRLLLAQSINQTDNVAEIDMSGIANSGVYLLTLKQKSSFKTFRIVKQ